MNEQEEVSVRRVTKDDYSKIMDMFPPGEIYNGIDYLPDYFNMLIDMPNVEAYAATMNDKFVSFALFTVVDDGRTVVSRAMRTRKEYEGRGFSNILYEWFLNTSSKREFFIYEIKTTPSQHHVILKKLQSKQRYSVLRRHTLCFIGANRQEFKMELQHNIDLKKSGKLINEVELGDLLTDQDVCNKLFPEERVLVDRVPYKLVKSNAGLIKTERTTIVVSSLPEQESTLISFLNYYHACMGFVCIVDVYGENDSSLKEHLLIHFKNILQEETFDNITIFFYCDQGANHKLICDFMISCKLENYEKVHSGLICTEQKI